MATVRSHLATVATVPRFAIVGAVSAFLVGGFAGLILGLIAYPPTAWFAVLELGIPAAMLGAGVGALAGVVAGSRPRADDL